MKIEAVDPASRAARDLIARSDAYMASLYPAESNHLESVEALKRPNVIFLGCHLGGALVGCGAAKIVRYDPAFGEIKRVFVLEEHRGKQLSKRIMQELEDRLIAAGIGLARLETGIRQPEALGLYRKIGYVERGPFGHYRADPLSLFMEKRLASGAAAGWDGP